MNIKSILSAFAVTFFFCVDASAADNSAQRTVVQYDTITVMTYNVHNCKAMSGEFNIEKIAEVINCYNPDIVAVEELDSMTTRHPKYVLGELAALTDLNPFYCPTIDYAGGKYGIGLLTRRMPLFVPKYPLADSAEPRGVIVAEYDNFVMGVTHLGLGKADRLRQVDFLRGLAQVYVKPFIIAGDFNFHPDSEAFAELAKTFTPLTDTTVCTFPANAPDETIDYIMLTYGADYYVLSREVIEEPNASDHRPVVVTLALPRRK